MNNTLALAVYIPLSAVSATLLLLSIMDRRRHLFRQRLAFLNACILGWQLTNVAYYLLQNHTALRMLYDLDLGFVALTCLAVLLFVLHFYELDHHLTPALLCALCIIPVATTLLSLTVDFQSILRQELVIISTAPAHVVATVRGPWFWVHTAYCYLMTAASAVIVAYMHRRLQKPMRFSSTLLLAGIFSTLAANILVLLNPIGIRLDFTIIGAGITSLLLYISVRNNRGLEYLMHERELVFNNLSKWLIVFDSRGKAVTMNQAARQRFSTGDVEEEGFTRETLVHNLTEHALRVERPEDESTGVDYYFQPESDAEMVLNLREKQIFNGSGKHIGTLLIGNDVTENRKLIQQLEFVAGMDSLTGLANRHRMALAQSQLDRPEYLPLSVIVGDLNNLKKVNDSLGHSAGDILLRRTAEVLQACCPPNAQVARMGGDEFMVLLPNTAAMTAQAIISNIKKELKATPVRALRPSLAMGYAVKRQPSQLLEDTIQKADSAMYANKHSERS